MHENTKMPPPHSERPERAVGGAFWNAVDETERLLAAIYAARSGKSVAFVCRNREIAMKRSVEAARMAPDALPCRDKIQFLYGGKVEFMVPHQNTRGYRTVFADDPETARSLAGKPDVVGGVLPTWVSDPVTRKDFEDLARAMDESESMRDFVGERFVAPPKPARIYPAHTEFQQRVLRATQNSQKRRGR